VSGKQWVAVVIDFLALPSNLVVFFSAPNRQSIRNSCEMKLLRNCLSPASQFGEQDKSVDNREKRRRQLARENEARNIAKPIARRDLVASHRRRLINEAARSGSDYLDIEDTKMEVIKRLTAVSTNIFDKNNNNNNNMIINTPLVKLKKGAHTEVDTRINDDPASINPMALDVVDFHSPFSKNVDFSIFNSHEGKKTERWLTETQRIASMRETSRRYRMDNLGSSLSEAAGGQTLMSADTLKALEREFPERLYGKGAGECLRGGGEGAEVIMSKLRGKGVGRLLAAGLQEQEELVQGGNEGDEQSDNNNSQKMDLQIPSQHGVLPQQSQVSSLGEVEDLDEEAEDEAKSVNTFANIEVITRGTIIAPASNGNNFSVGARRESIKDLRMVEAELDELSFVESLNDEGKVEEEEADDAVQNDTVDALDISDANLEDKSDGASSSHVSNDFVDDSDYSDFSDGGSPRHSPRKTGNFQSEHVIVDNRDFEKKAGGGVKDEEREDFKSGLQKSLLGSTLHASSTLSLSQLVLQQELLSRRQPLDEKTLDLLNQKRMLIEEGVRTREELRAKRRQEEAANDKKKKPPPMKKKKKKEAGEEVDPESLKKKNTSVYRDATDYISLHYPTFQSSARSLQRIRNEGEIHDVVRTLGRYGLSEGEVFDRRTGKARSMEEVVRRALEIPQDKPINVALANMPLGGEMLMGNPVCPKKVKKSGVKKKKKKKKKKKIT